MSAGNSSEKRIDQLDAGTATTAHGKLHDEAVHQLSRPHPAVKHVHAATSSHLTIDDVAPVHGGFGPNGFWARHQEDYYDRGDMMVLGNDNINSVAARALRLRGQSTAGRDAVPDEASRIVALNMSNPIFANQWNRHHKLETGTILKITEDRIGPDIHTAWAPWQNAQPGVTTIVGRGARVVAGPNTNIIVEPGGAAAVYGKAYAYQGSHIELYTGANAVSAGAKVMMHPGAHLVAVRPSEVRQVTNEEPGRPRLFPR